MTWTATAGGLRPGQIVVFPLSIRVPDGRKGTVLTFKALQTYRGGEVVRWIGAPSSEEPAPQVVLRGANQSVGRLPRAASAPRSVDLSSVGLYGARSPCLRWVSAGSRSYVRRRRARAHDRLLGSHPHPLPRCLYAAGQRDRVSTLRDMRRAMTWLLIVPLALLGSEAAHGLDFWLAAPDPADRARLLPVDRSRRRGFRADGDRVLRAAPAARARWACARGARHGAVARLPFAPFAFLPLLAFALRELMERSSEHGELVLQTFTEPIVLSGLALQLPFALLRVPCRTGAALRRRSPQLGPRRRARRLLASRSSTRFSSSRCDGRPAAVAACLRGLRPRPTFPSLS